MPGSVTNQELRRMVESEDAQVVEVLDREEFESEHIEGAISLPLKELNAESARKLDRDRPVVLYCNDFL